MNSISRAAIGATLVILVSSCSGATAKQVTIPTSDSTSPSVTMDIFLPNQSTPLTVTPTTPFTQTTPAVTARADDKVTVIARGDDSDGGIQSIQIWTDYTRVRNGVLEHQGLPSTPEASNSDAGSIGSTAQKSRLVSLNLDIKKIRTNSTWIRVDVWATATNFHSGKVSTVVAKISWP